MVCRRGEIHQRFDADVAALRMAIAGGRLFQVTLARVVESIRVFFLENDQRDSTKNRDGRKYQAHGDGLTKENNAAQGRKDRNTELHCCSVGRFQCGQRCIPNGIPNADASAPDETAYQNPALSRDELVQS